MNNETIKMKSINVDGIEIIKDVPIELYSNYLAIGWEKVEPKPTFAKLIKDKDTKKNENI